MTDYKRLNRLQEALELRGKKQIDLHNALHISKTTINGWIKNAYQPKQDALYKLAKYLDVSEMWLAGYDVPMDRPKTNDYFYVEYVASEEDDEDAYRRKLERYATYIKKLALLKDDQAKVVTDLIDSLSEVDNG